MRTEAVAERLFGLKWALRKDSTEIIHEEWNTASEWIRDGYLRQAIEVLAAAVQGITGLPDALAQPMRQLDQALAQIGSLPADPTNEPTKENKQ